MKKLLLILFFIAAGPLDITGSFQLTAQAQSRTISGNAGTDNAILSYDDGGPKTATSAANGNYSFTVPNNWSGTVTPAKTGFTFTPVSRTYTNVTSNQTNQNFTPAAITYLISGNTGTNGVTLSYNDGGPKTATSNSSGNYSFAVSYNWSGTVTPSKTGWTFSPVNIAYANVLTNQTDQNYAGTRITFTISGNAGVAGATISWTDTTAKTSTADGSGNYSIVVSYSFDGTVTPSKTGYTFTPASYTYSNVTSNQVNKNHTASRITYTISGDAGTAGVLLSWTDTTAKSIVAGTGGNYSIVVSYGWSGTITPSRTGFSYSPSSRTYTNVLANDANENYTETPITYTISGNTGAPGVTLSYNDGGAKTATSNSSGDYAFTVSYNWTGTVTPTKTGWTFAPVNIAYANVLSNQTAQDYAATRITFIISGNAGVAGATISWTDTTAKTVTSDDTGHYAIVVSYSYDGTVTPSKYGYAFTPANYVYTNVLANQSNKNHTAARITFTISGDAGSAGVLLSWTDTTAKSTVAGAGGNYSIVVSYGWSGTITPTRTGFTYSPLSRSYTNVVANNGNEDFTETAGSTIFGNVGASNVTLSFTDGTPKTVTSNSAGNYSLIVSPNWSGTVTPSRTGFSFVPVNRTYTNVNSNTGDQNYSAIPVTFTISGNTGIGAVQLNWTDTTAKTAVSDGAGNYTIVVSYSYDGTVTPSKTGYTFSPANIVYSNVIANQVNKNYTAHRITYTISGRSERNGAVMHWVDTTAKSVVSTGIHGDYTFEVSYGWSGTVTPVLAGVVFTPFQRTYTNVLSDRTGQNYSDVDGWTIAGNAGVAGAVLNWTDGTARNVTADGSGNYLLTVTNLWDGTVTPVLAGYTFTPANISYVNVSANQTNKNYTATPFVTVDLKAFLAGPFSGGGMTTSLNTAALIPLNSQNAYDATTYGYTAKLVPAIPNANVVDWVLVELRTGTAAATKVAAQAAFMKNDGSVVDTNGTSVLKFNGIAAGLYNVVIRHRNHLPVMTSAAITLSAASPQYDFTTDQAKAYGTNAMSALSGSVFGLPAGDLDRNGSVSFTGPSSDRTALLSVIGLTDPTMPVSGYLDVDANMDGSAKFTGPDSDRSVILTTVGLTDPTIPVVSQVPN